MLTARFHDSLDTIDAAAWDSLLANDNPFVRHAFLSGLEQHGCIREAWGWQSHHLTLHDDQGQIVAAAPLYLKGNSHGEYVFDWNWAAAWERAGGHYYPKLLCAVPYSPVTGPRLLADTSQRRRELVDAIIEETRHLGLSSAHVDFLPESSTDAFDAPWLNRFDWQYHWTNRGYRDFDDFLTALRHKKRKNIRAERAQVRRSGLDCRMHAGQDLSAADWDAIHALYLHTFDSKGNQPTLSLAFFRHLARVFTDQVQVALARRDGDIIAMAIFMCSHDTLYGRYWGSHELVPDLHFELCYYQGIEYAIAHQLARFEPGAQGLHKLARGFLPIRTFSRHYVAHSGFRLAVADALMVESELMESHARHLMAHSPYAHEHVPAKDAP